jgi:hypothetical protein
MKARKIPITATTAIMSTCPSRRESPPRAAAPAPARRLRRLAAAATAIIGSLLASAAVIPAASAAVPTPSPAEWAQIAQLWRLGPVRVVPATTVRVVSAGGMAGWQITLIAAGAALAAAVAAVVLDRARAARRTATATTS